MIRNMRSGMPTLFKKGSSQISGKLDSTIKSLEACIQLATILATSFGPNGLNKIVINHLGRVSVTSDSASISKEVEINHPVAKMVKIAAEMQEKEIGDGSNFVFIFAGQLCQQAKQLIEDGVEINDIIKGFKIAQRESDRILDSIKITEKSLSEINSSEMERLIFAAVCSKIGEHAEHFSRLIATACISQAKNNVFDVDCVRVCKVAGAGLCNSFLHHGLVVEAPLSLFKQRFHCQNKSTTELKNKLQKIDEKLTNVKVAIFNGSIDTQSTETKGVVLLESAEALLNFNSGEERRVEAAIKQLKNLGVGLVLTGGKIGDVAAHFLQKAEIDSLKIGSKFELQRLVRLVNCNAVPIFGDPITAEDLGYCSKVWSASLGSKELTFLEQDPLDTRFSTIVVRGSSEFVLDSGQKAVDDGVNMAKTISKDPRLAVGGGAAEMALSSKLREFSNSASFASAKAGIEGYARALETFPGILAKSVGLKANEAISKLSSVHLSDGENSSFGINFKTGKISDLKDENIFDAILSKSNAMRLATEVVCTALQIDYIIMAKPAGGPKFGKKHDWDED